jgi:hypothetical protein
MDAARRRSENVWLRSIVMLKKDERPDGRDGMSFAPRPDAFRDDGGFIATSDR